MKNKEIIIKCSLLLFFLIVVISFLIRFDVKDNISSIQAYIHSYGRFATIIYIIIFILRTLLIFFPASVMFFIAGSLFGEIHGFIISIICIILSASFAFFISRYAGKDYVNKIIKGKTKKLDLKAEEHGFKLIFLMRVSFIFPFDIMNYAAGLSKIKYFDFMMATLLGMIPEVLSITYISSNIGNPMSLKFKVAIVFFVVTVAIPFFFSRRKRVNEKKI